MVINRYKIPIIVSENNKTYKYEEKNNNIDGCVGKMKYEKPKVVSVKNKSLDIKSPLPGEFPMGKVYL